jgi:hypothetical protein
MNHSLYVVQLIDADPASDWSRRPSNRFGAGSHERPYRPVKTVDVHTKLTPEARAIAQAVSRRLPTVAARGAGAGFLRVFRFPLPIFIPAISPQSPSPIIRGWYNRLVLAAVPKVPPRKLKKKKTGARVGFLRVLRFPLPILIPPISPQSPSPII